MIRSLVIAALLSARAASAQDEATPVPAAEVTPAPTPPTPASTPAVQFAPAPAPSTTEPKQDTSIDRFRTPVEALSERMIGTASKSVRFDWRRSKVGFGIIGSELLERNNFGTTRIGAFVRKPFGSFMGELAVTRAITWGTDSSAKLSLTPYRQYGRPSRIELDINVGYALAEGVVTALPSWLPPAEMVFSVNGGLRYLWYPFALNGAKIGPYLQGLAAPQLTDREYRNLEPYRTPGMQIDPARYGMMAGFNLDLYFQPGAFLSPRAMIALPVLSSVNGTGLGYWYELTMSVGWAL